MLQDLQMGCWTKTGALYRMRRAFVKQTSKTDAPTHTNTSGGVACHDYSG
ncbi:hypothetical protein ARMA_0526 [Ardenticatena maritima]|uniref:Uncharacterized protein n=1 Tax=Ardenticatena maritima TaxID=872965 RepID=A0A0M8K5G7_9CHLR|nr:hypothetical protein ARMA_0526 [Ardenticatena maritima]